MTFIRQLDAECWVALEVTGNAFEAHDMLSPHVGKVLLANPLELKRLGSGRHTDRVDAECLAKMLALGMLPTVCVPPQAVRGVRRLLQYRDRLVRNRRRYLAQAKAVLQRHYLHVPRKVNPRRWLEREAVQQLPEVDRIILLSSLRQLTSVDGEIQAIEAEIARHVVDEPGVQLLLSITGVGIITAATLWAYIGDPVRFRTAKQVTRYAGLDASIKAVVALARKLLVVAWRMLLTGEPYRAAKPSLIEQKRRQLVRWLDTASDWDALLQQLWCVTEETGRPTTEAA